MRIEKEKIVVGIHSEPNHPDDVLCVALLVKEYGEENVEVKRTRDLDILKTCDYILDVGGKDEIVTDENGNIVQVWLDHHQPDSGYEENGVKKASCSKLVNFLYEDKGKDFIKELRYWLVDPVAVSDNGQDLDMGQNLLNFVGTTIEQDWTEEPNKEKSDELFTNTRRMVNYILDKVITRIENRDFGREYVKKALDEAIKTNKEYIVLDKYIPRYIWNDMLMRYNDKAHVKIKATILPTTHKAWDGIMVHKERNSFKCIINYPVEWLGLRDKELERVSGIKDAVFCHTEGFFFEGNTKDSAIEAVEKAIKKGV